MTDGQTDRQIDTAFYSIGLKVLKSPEFDLIRPSVEAKAPQEANKSVHLVQKLFLS